MDHPSYNNIGDNGTKIKLENPGVLSTINISIVRFHVGSRY